MAPSALNGMGDFKCSRVARSASLHPQPSTLTSHTCITVVVAYFSSDAVMKSVPRTRSPASMNGRPGPK